jgi:hypothetical protein
VRERVVVAIGFALFGKLKETARLLWIVLLSLIHSVTIPRSVLRPDMHLIYIDDSWERPTQTYAAIAVAASSWRASFNEILTWRRHLKASDGIFIRREFHATEFVAGRGRIGLEVVTKYRRCQIFREAFSLLNGLHGVKVFTSCRTSRPEWAFERLLTRIHKTMETWDSHAILIVDEGKELEMTRLCRKMAVFNPVPVYTGPRTLVTQNIATHRILEDPFFKDSAKSFFVQMADFVAYGLLRREQHLASKNKYGLHGCFDLLADVVVREASPKDGMGVIR